VAPSEAAILLGPAEAGHWGRRGRVEPRLDVHALASRREGRQMARPAREHVHGAVMVQAAQVTERGADLQDALDEAFDRAEQ